MIENGTAIQRKNKRSNRRTKTMTECTVKKTDFRRMVKLSIFSPMKGMIFRMKKMTMNRIMPGKAACRSGKLGGISEMMQNNRYVMKILTIDLNFQFLKRVFIMEKEADATRFQ